MIKIWQKTAFLALFAGIAGLFSGCTTAIVAGNTAVNYATEDRAFSSSVADNENEISLRSDLFQKSHTYPVDVSLIISERRLLIVGEVDTQDDIDTILATLWANPYITEVYNQIKIKTGRDIVDKGADFLMNKNAWAVLVKTADVTSANYKTLVRDNVLYIIGSTNSAAEKERAIAALKTARGLRKIVEYINII